ncbi:lipoprotein [Enterococcus faecalis]|nr:lipoprotein [Enterococcus faecalis]
MKKLILFLGSLFLLSGCGYAKDLTEYVDVEFMGMDTQGTATYTIDTEKLNKDVFKYDSESDFLDEKEQEEMSDFYNSFKIKLDKTDKLSNGDKVKVIAKVNEKKTKKIKSGEKEVVVEGLEEPQKLTSEDVEKHLVINFNGVSGRGVAQIDNTFDSPLNTITFTIENDGKLKNGDKAKIEKTKELEEALSSEGYVLDKKFAPEFEVKGLAKVAEEATDIANLEDIKRMIDEEVKRQYKDSEYFSKYEITLNKLMYRQFAKENSDEDNGWYSSSNTDGNLIGIYTIKEYSTGTDSKLRDTFTAIIGYSDIVLNDKNEVNVAEMEKISTTKDDTYSLESVIKLYEGYGYTEVK